MYSKAAERSADIGDYAKAIELYEQVGDWSLGNSLTKYSVKDYWLRAALCSIAMGVSPRGRGIPSQRTAPFTEPLPHDSRTS